MDVKKSSREYKVLKVVDSCGGLDAMSIHARVQVSEPELVLNGFKEDYLDRLERSGMVFYDVKNNKYFITGGGVAAIEEADAPPEEFIPQKATGVTVPKFLPASHGNYTGRELQRTVTRPGAYDAFSKPSLIGSKHHYRRDHAH